MKDKDTLYARWLSNEITEEELQSLREDGAIDDLQKIINATDTWKLSAYNKTEGLKKLKSIQTPKETIHRRRSLKWILGIVGSLIALVALLY